MQRQKDILETAQKLGLKPVRQQNVDDSPLELWKITNPSHIFPPNENILQYIICFTVGGQNPERRQVYIYGNIMTLNTLFLLIKKWLKQNDAEAFQILGSIFPPHTRETEAAVTDQGKFTITREPSNNFAGYLFHVMYEYHVSY